MKLATLLFAALTCMPSLCGADSSGTEGLWGKETPVYEVLKALGEPMPSHYLPDIDPQAVKRGEEIVRYGSTTAPDGSRSEAQSRHFTCVRCHNTRREDPDLRVSDPEARLDYALQNQLPFLPGTTLYGVVNRSTWFNGDYVHKYETMTSGARNDLINAIQLCSTECSMGRRLEEWEVKSVLAFFWSLQLRLGDLNLTPEDWNKLQQARSQPGAAKGVAAWLKGFYLQASPATFSPFPAPRSGTPSGGKNVEKGRAIYVLSCLSCHDQDGVAAFVFRESPSHYRLLRDQAGFMAKFSIDHAIRNGIKASPGKGYMPNFTLQRMSDRQIEDLRAFLEHQASYPPLGLEPYRSWLTPYYRRP